MQDVYVNKNEVPQSLTGSQEWQVDKLDFDTSCPCQITACDGGTIKICAPVTFDPPLPDPGFDPCNIGTDASFTSVSTLNSGGFKLLNSSATCASPGIANTALVGIDNVGEPGLGQFTETLLQCETSYSGGANVRIYNPGKGAPDRVGMRINGGTDYHSCNLEMRTNVAGADISVISSEDVKITAGQDVEITCGTGGSGSFIGNTAFPFDNMFTKFIGAFRNEAINVFSRRINLATTISNVATFPTPGGPEGIIPASSAAGGFPGDLSGDMVLGYYLTDLTLYLFNAGQWLRLQKVSNLTGNTVIFGTY